jgi:NADPH2:quinone reductase
MLKRLTLTGSTLRGRSIAEKAGLAEVVRQRVWPLFADGRLTCVIDSVFPLAEAAAAHRAMEAGGHTGKLVLSV